MHRRTTPKVFSHSQELRHDQTEAEAKLWRVLRARQTNDVHFRRQHANALRPFRVGNYIVDFCSPRQKLIIELDGTPFGRSTLNNKNMTSSALNFCNPRVIAFCDFGIMT